MSRIDKQAVLMWFTLFLCFLVLVCDMGCTPKIPYLPGVDARALSLCGALHGIIEETTLKKPN